LREVWKLHGLLKLIIANWDTKWTSGFWDGLCSL
jgi:hypothetical protein